MDTTSKKNKFTVILLIVSAVLFIVGVLAFSGRLGGNNRAANQEPGAVVVWGTLPEVEFSRSVETIYSKRNDISILYVRVDSKNIKNLLAEAIVFDSAPDVIISDVSTFYNIKNYTQPIPYTSYPEASFRQTFVNIGHDLLWPEGVVAIPLLVDPIVLFHNREILSASGIVNPPTLWSELYDMYNSIVKIEEGQVVRQSMIPFGQYRNVNNAWAVMSTLFLQSRIPIARYSLQGSELAKTVNLKTSDISSANEAGTMVLDFYNQFSDPSSQFYNWNRTKLDSKREFTEGRLAFYPSFASESRELRERNPNLNFSLSQIPQLNQNPAFYATYGELYVASIVAKNKNPLGSYTAVFEFTAEDFQKTLSQNMIMAPALSNVLSLPPETTLFPIVYKSALISKSWYNEDMENTQNTFSSLIENINSGKLSPLEAISQAENSLR